MSPSTASPAKSSTTERRRWRGQSLIEGMVAMTIIITSVSSAMVVVQSSIRSSTLSGAAIIADNLAREGLEVVRSIRDSNWLAGQSFQTGLVSGTIKSARPIVDPTPGQWSLNFSAITIDDPAAIMYLNLQNIYVQTDAPTGTPTSYKRLIVINHVCRDTTTGAERIAVGTDLCAVSESFVGLDAASSVKYPTAGGGTRTATVQERLYDWR